VALPLRGDRSRGIAVARRARTTTVVPA